MKRVLGILAALAIILGGTYLASPALLAWGVPIVAKRYGIEITALTVHRPGYRSARVDHMEVAVGGAHAALDGIDLTYRWETLLEGRFERVDVDSARAVLAAPKAAAQATLPLVDPLAIWQVVPADTLTVRSFEIIRGGERAQGEILLDPEGVDVNMQGDLGLVTLTAARSGAARAEVQIDGFQASFDGQAAQDLVEGVVTGTYQSPAFNSTSKATIEVTPSRVRATAAAGTRIVPAPLHAPDQRWRVDLPTLTTAAPADIDVDVVTSSVAIERIELEPTAMALRVGADDYALRTGSIELQSIGVTPSASAASWATESATASIGGNDFVLGLRGDIVLADRTLKGGTDVASGDGSLVLPVTYEHALATGRGEAAVDTTFEIARPLIASILPDAGYVFDLDAGTVDIDGQAAWSRDDWATSTSIRLTEGEAHYDTIMALGIVFDGILRITSAAATLVTGEIAVERIDVGFPFDDASAQIEATAKTIRVYKGIARMLGGRATASDFAYDVTTRSTDFEVTFEGLSLAQLLAVYGDDPTGSGTLDGTVPMTIGPDGMSVSGGRLNARAPGGVIRYQAIGGVAEMIDQPQSDLALRAMQDFSYETLTADVDYATDGTLSLGISLFGKNPRVTTRPFQFNVNVTQNLPPLLRSLRLTRAFEKRIERRLAEKGTE